MLARLEEHVGGPHVQLRALRLRAARKDEAGARERWTRCCGWPTCRRSW